MDTVDRESHSVHQLEMVTSCIEDCRKQERETIESRIVLNGGKQHCGTAIHNSLQKQFRLSASAAADTRSRPVIALIGCMGCFQKELNR